MNNKKVIIWFVWVYSPLALLGQCYNYRLNYENPTQFIYWDKEGAANLYKPNITFFMSEFQKTAICRSNGNLLFYTDNTKIIDYNNKVVKNSDSLLPTLNGQNIILQITDSTYWLIQCFTYINAFDGNKIQLHNYLLKNNYDTNITNKNISGIYYTEVKNTKLGLIIVKKNILLTSSIDYQLTFTRRINGYKYLMCFIKTNRNIEKLYKSFHIGVLNNNGLIITDSMNIYNNNLASEIRNSAVSLTPNTILRDQNILPYSISRNCDKIIYTTRVNLHDTNINNYIYSSGSLLMKSINTNTFKFNSLTDTIAHSEGYNEDIFPIRQKNKDYGFVSWNEYILFSPNDSILFVNQNIIYNAKKTPRTDSLRTNEFGYFNFRKNWFFNPILGNKISPSGSNNTSNKDCFLNSNGKLVFYEDLRPNSSYFSELLNTNNPIKSEFKSTKVYNREQLVFNNYLYDYTRCFINVQYKDCGAYVNIKNNTDESIGLENYEWEIALNKTHSKWFKYNGKTPPQIFYKENGYYYYKMHATSLTKTRYSEYYIDSIYINIPPKPVANFYAKDSIVCRYTGLQFYNHSYAKDTIKNEYLWSFGDGNTSTAKNPMHTYTNPGVYTVTLHYKNGYCDSTLTKNQYIKIVDAPKPGFSVLYKQGCAPFVAQLKDTTTINVQQKDYYFSDTKLWQNVPVFQPNFTHTFTKPGVYKALQRLTGYTGCIIQTDSVVFNISKGLTTTVTLNIINSTVQTKNALTYWPKIDGAVKYQLFKNNITYKTITDTFYHETIPYLKDASYTVAGIDSCGNLCSYGRQGKPVFIQGTMVGNNEAAAITFSPYLQWQGNNLVYKIQKLINGNWATINSQNDNNALTDFNFLNPNDLQACYRIESYELSYPNIISHSNELCIPYIPTIFIPSAFTPNNDGVNDVFDVVNFGLKSYTITVYNRWGEEIFKGQNKQAWDGTNCADGVYTASINYTTNKGIKLHQRLTVTLIK